MAIRLFYKITWVILSYFLLLSAYKLLFNEESVISYLDLKERINVQQEINNKKSEVNSALYAEVDSLKHGYAAVEERARNDLGLIKNGEKFYQIVD